jgi:hypothetical protein
MAFPFFFKRHFRILAKAQTERLVAATTELAKATEKATARTGVAPTALLRETKERIRRRKMLPPYLRSIGSALKQLNQRTKELRRAAVEVTARVAVPTILQSAIAAYSRTHGVPYDAALAEEVAGHVARMPEGKWALVGRRTPITKSDYAVKTYLARLTRKRKAAGLSSPVAAAPAWAKFAISAFIKAKAIPLASAGGAEYADRAFEEAFLEVPMPGFLDGGTIDDMLEGADSPF